MPSIEIDGRKVAYEIYGEGDPIALTPGGRFTMEVPGLRELAKALAPNMKVLIWDRPNCGASEVKFTGESEANMHADTLAKLLQALDMAPAVIAGGSAGSRVSIITALRHPEVARKLICWWIVGGTFGTMVLAPVYCLPFLTAAYAGGMEAVAALPNFEETIAANPDNRQRLLDLDVNDFIKTMERWLWAYVPDNNKPIPGVTAEQIASISVPSVIFRSGKEDRHHPEETSLWVQRLLRNSKLVEPPWGEDEWPRLQRLSAGGQLRIFETWPNLAPQIVEYAKEA